MAFTHAFAANVSVDVKTVAINQSFTGSKNTSVDETLSVGTNTLIGFTADVSAIKSIIIKAGDGALTVKTNSSSTPDDTLTVPASGAYIWNTSSLDANLLGTDITALYVTNAAASSLRIECLEDSTP